MKTDHSKSRESSLPILQGVLPNKARQIPAELIAGLTLAALAIPEVLGYTKIAGTPVVTGLYTMLIPMALFALFGSSRYNERFNEDTDLVGLALLVAQVMEDIREESRYHLDQLFGKDAFYETLEDIVNAYREGTGAAPN